MRTRTRIASALAAAGLAIGLTATAAQANAQYGCTALGGHLHATSTLLNYGSGVGTGIYTSATYHYKEVRTFGTDHDWYFKRMTLVNYSTRYTNPTQWGGPTHPMSFSTKYVRVTWIALGGEISTSCLVKVGV